MKIMFFLPALFWVLATPAHSQSLPDVVINEFMAVNDSLSNITDPAGQHDDWVELFNRTGSAIDLAGYYLSDDYANPTLWQFPAGVTIAGNGYLIVWADKDITQLGLHADFKLNRDSEMLVLSDPIGLLLDSISYGYQENNFSMSRIPNGSGPFLKTLPTFNANNGTSSTFEIVPPFFSVFPNPSPSEINLRLQDGFTESVLIELLDANGNTLYQERGKGKNIYQLSGFQGVSGILYVKVQAGNKEAVVPVVLVR